MVQKVLPLKRYNQATVELPETAQAVGLRCEDSVVTLRFMAEETARWGQPARLVRIDRKLAEQLSRLLADELEDYS
jgi:hypothetical protein